MKAVLGLGSSNALTNKSREDAILWRKSKDIFGELSRDKSREVHFLNDASEFGGLGTKGLQPTKLGSYHGSSIAKDPLAV